MQGGKHREELPELREKLNGDHVSAKWSPKLACFVRFGHRDGRFWYEKIAEDKK